MSKTADKLKTLKARKFISKVMKLAAEENLPVFVVTDGASGYSNNGNDAVSHARHEHELWEKKHGFDPDEDWGSEKGG